MLPQTKLIYGDNQVSIKKQRILKMKKPCKMMVSILMVSALLFNKVFIDAGYATNIMLTNTAERSQLRPPAAELESTGTDTTPGDVGADLISENAEKYKVTSSLKDKTIEVVKALGRSGQANIRPIITLARQIYPDFDPDIPENQWSSTTAEMFLVLNSALMYQIYIPNNEIFYVVLIAAEPDILRWKINQESWQEQDYLKSKIWIAESLREGGYLTYGLGLGWFAVVDSDYFRKEGKERYGELMQIFGIYASPYVPAMISIMEISQVGKEDFVEGVVVGHGHQEEIRHAQDISYAAQKLRRDLRMDLDALEQTASEILKPDSPLHQRLFASLAQQARGNKTAAKLNRQVSVVTTLEYSARLGGVIAEMKKHKANNRDELAFLAFLNFMEEQFLRATPKKIPKTDIVALANINVAVALFQDIDEWAGVSIDHTSTEVIRMLGMRLGQYPVEKTLRMLEEIYAKHFLTDDERYARLTAEPFKLKGPSFTDNALYPKVYQPCGIRLTKEIKSSA